jgi:hypothetical protein
MASKLPEIQNGYKQHSKHSILVQALKLENYELCSSSKAMDSLAL